MESVILEEAVLCFCQSLFNNDIKSIIGLWSKYPFATSITDKLPLNKKKSRNQKNTIPKSNNIQRKVIQNIEFLIRLLLFSDFKFSIEESSFSLFDEGYNGNEKMDKFFVTNLKIPFSCVSKETMEFISMFKQGGGYFFNGISLKGVSTEKYRLFKFDNLINLTPLKKKLLLGFWMEILANDIKSNFITDGGASILHIALINILNDINNKKLKEGDFQSTFFQKEQQYNISLNGKNDSSIKTSTSETNITSTFDISSTTATISTSQNEDNIQLTVMNGKHILSTNSHHFNQKKLSPKQIKDGEYNRLMIDMINILETPNGLHDFFVKCMNESF